MRKFDTHIESVTLKNFLSFYEGHVEFDSGLTVIVGPNGSGKPSIFHAIKFALGSNQRENRYSKWSDFIRHGASSAEVEVVAAVNGQNRKFERKISKDGIPRSYVDGKRVKAAELQNLVSDLGFDIDNPLVFMPQERINAIRDMDPIEVRKLIEEGTGLSVLRDRIHLEEVKVHHSKEKLTAATSEAQVVERELELLQGDVERLQRKRELLKQEGVLDTEVKWASLDDLAKNIAKVRSDIEEKELGLGEVLDEIVALEDKVDTEEFKAGKLEQDASSLQREMGGITARIDEEERRLNKIEGDTKHVLDEIRELEKRIKSEKRHSDKTREDLRRISTAKEQILENQKQTGKELDELEEEREKTENELAAFAEWNSKRSEALGTYRTLQTDIKGKDLLFRSLQEKLQNDEAELQAIESKWGHIWATLEGTDEKELALKKGQVEREISSLNEKRFQHSTQVSQLQKEIDDIRLKLTESTKRIPDSVMELSEAVSDDYASALEAVVPGNLAFSFIAEDEAEFALLHRLRDKIEAPSPIIFVKDVKSMKKEKSLPTWKGVVGYLWDLIGLDPEMVSKMRAAFGDYVVTKDTQTSTRSAQRENLLAVSLDGHLSEPSDNRIISHPRREPSGVIATAPLQARLASAESELVISRNQMTDIIGRIEKVTQEREEVMDLMSQVTRWSGTWERRKKLRDIIPNQEERIVALDDEIKKLQVDFGKAERALKKLDSTQPPERSRLVGQQSALRMKYRKLRGDLTQIESRLQATQNDQSTKRHDLRGLEESMKMLSERADELREEIASSKSDGSKIVELIENLRSGLENTRTQYDALVAQQTEVRGDIRTLSERLLELNLSVKDSRIQVLQSKRQLESF
ncbi:MAG: AAA family ATPase, partial [Candidatus Thorarchaeota archaeon]